MASVEWKKNISLNLQTIRESDTYAKADYLYRQAITRKGAADTARRSFGSRNTLAAVRNATKLFDAAKAKRQQLHLKRLELEKQKTASNKTTYKVMNQSHHACSRIPNLHGKNLNLTSAEALFYSSHAKACGGALSLKPIPDDPKALQTHQFDDYFRAKKNEMMIL